MHSHNGLALNNYSNECCRNENDMQIAKVYIQRRVVEQISNYCFGYNKLTKIIFSNLNDE